jgi:hypothetical protein
MQAEQPRKAPGLGAFCLPIRSGTLPVFVSQPALRSLPTILLTVCSGAFPP